MANPAGSSLLASPLLFATLLFPMAVVFAGDTLRPGESLRDGDEALSSAGGVFELGFFSPGVSKNRFLGIWFKDIANQTVVWVANRENPIADTSGLLYIESNGTLVLLNGSSGVVWSSSSSPTTNPVAQILDSGNLVVKGADPQFFSWETFDCPGRTLLAGAKFSVRSSRGTCFTSWRSEDDPSPGVYGVRMGPHGEFFIWEGPERRYRYRSGPWNGRRFSGIPEMNTLGVFTDTFVVSAAGDMYYEYEINEPVLVHLYCDSSGVVRRLIWRSKESAWHQYYAAPKDQCDLYANCGPFGVCNSNDSPVCSCLEGFQPKSPENWNLRDATGGCTRKTMLNCSADGFLLVRGVKLPDMRNATVNYRIGLGECRDVCWKNCSCTAYVSANITEGGSGCIIWVGDLVDLREYTEGGQDLYIRLAASELDSINSGQKRRTRPVIVLIAVALTIGILLTALIVFCLWKKKKRKGTIEEYNFDNAEEEMELPLFDFNSIAIATENFSLGNKLGEGGFGPVYKGKIKHGQEIAVKRLSKYSVQGVEEFKNEVRLIVKLQHRNLVQLLGCCVEGEDKMLVYEYMPNKSLAILLLFTEFHFAQLHEVISSVPLRTSGT